MHARLDPRYARWFEEIRKFYNIENKSTVARMVIDRGLEFHRIALRKYGVRLNKGTHYLVEPLTPEQTVEVYLEMLDTLPEKERDRIRRISKDRLERQQLPDSQLSDKTVTDEK